MVTGFGTIEFPEERWGNRLYKCKNCRDTGRITLLFSTVDCDCRKKHEVGSPPNLEHYTRESGLLNGWFSQLHASQSGWAVYLDEKGNRRDVTEVSVKPIPISKHEDLEFIGIVTKYVETVDSLSAPINYGSRGLSRMP